MIKPLAKSVLIPLGLTAAASAADAGIHKKILGSGYNNNNNNNNNIQIGKKQLHFIRLNHVLFDLNKFSKDTAFMFTFTPFSSVKLTASKKF